MRRSEREIIGFDEIIEVIKKCEVLHLGMVDQNKPYIVPLNFGYLVENGKLKFYLHSAKEGRKVDLMKRNPQVCFEMESLIKLSKSEIPCKWTTYYESIMGEGKIHFINEPDMKQQAMACIMKCNGYEGKMEFPLQMLERTQLFELEVEAMTGKRNTEK